MIDPRAKPPIGAEFFSGRITDTALALLDILNKVTGTGVGNNNPRYTVEDLDGNLFGRDMALGSFLIEPEYEDQPWKVPMTVFFNAAPQRLEMIKDELRNFNSFEDMEREVVGKVNELFNMIGDPNAPGSIAANLNFYENILERAFIDMVNPDGSTPNPPPEFNLTEFLNKGGDLEAEILKTLTDNSVITNAVNQVFDAVFLDTIISKFDPLKNLISDGDDNYSNGTTDAGEEYYFISLGDGEAEVIKASDPDSLDELFDRAINRIRDAHERQHGFGSWDQALEDSTIFSRVGNLFRQGALRMSDDLIDEIINDQNLTEEELKDFRQQGQFLRKYEQFEDFMNLAGSIYGTSDPIDTARELFKHHLDAATPRFYKDERTVFDILKGKGVLGNAGMPFLSAEQQIDGVGRNVIHLLNSGFNEASLNQLEEYVRSNPLSVIEYLEGERLGAGTPEEIQTIEDQIERLKEYNDRHIENLVRWLKEKSDRLKREDEVLHGPEIDNIELIMQDLLEVRELSRGFQDSTDLLAIKDLYGKHFEIEPLPAGGFSPEALKAIIEDAQLSIKNAHTALYANEVLVSGKLNARYALRKLPKPQADGTIPEDHQQAPPLIGPTPLAAVLAQIGKEILFKANNLVQNNDSLPNMDDMDELLGKFDQIQNNMFALKDKLKQSIAQHVLKKYMDRDEFKDLKAKVDQARKNLEAAKLVTDDILQGTNTPAGIRLGPGFNPGDINRISRDIQQDLIAAYESNSNSNIVVTVGLDNVEQYLEDLLDTNKSSSLTGQMASINRDINDLRNNIRLLEDGDPSNDPIDPQTNQVYNINQLQADLVNKLREINRLNGQASQVRNLLSEVDRRSTITKNEFKTRYSPLMEDYKNKLKGYSDAISDNQLDPNDPNSAILDAEALTQSIKDALASDLIDVDGDGINDFKVIQDTINKIDKVSDEITNIFGEDKQKEGSLISQDMKRLILLMFVFSILEYSDWDYRRQEADISRYAVFS